MIHKIDRITRSLRDFLQRWEAFERLGVHFISLREKFDTTSAMGRAMLKIVLVFAELEREQTGERTSATLDHRARKVSGTAAASSATTSTRKRRASSR